MVLEIKCILKPKKKKKVNYIIIKLIDKMVNIYLKFSIININLIIKNN